MQAINPINTHTKFGKDRINTFPSMSGNLASGRRTTEKAKIICPPPQWGGHNECPKFDIHMLEKRVITKTPSKQPSDKEECYIYGHCASALFNLSFMSIYYHIR